MKWFFLALSDKLLGLVSFFVVPFLVLFAKDARLPNWCRWFETDDNDLDGDEGWKNEHFVGWPRYIRRVLWLWRNPTYTYSREVCGFVVQPGFVYSVTGNEKVSNLPLLNGSVTRIIINPDGTKAWQWYYIRSWWGDSKCIRINLGWKLWGNKQAGDSCRLVLSISPWQMARK